MLLDAVHLPLTRRKTDCRRSIAEATRRARPLRRGLLEHNIAAEQAAAAIRTRALPLNSFSEAIAFDGTDLWVTNAFSSTVTRVRPY